MIRTTVRLEEKLFKDARKKNLVKKIKFGAYHLGKIKGSLRRVDIYDI